MTFRIKELGLLVAPLLLASLVISTRQIFSFSSQLADIKPKGETKIKENPSLILPKYDNKAVKDLRVWNIVPLKETNHSDVEVSNHPAIICACAKCGSTSFYHTIYEITHGKKWDYEGRPWVQNIGASQRWTDIRASRMSSKWANENSKHLKSIALIRDPKERILSSWKSKIMCIGSDSGDARGLVPHILQLADFSSNLTKHYIDHKGIETPCLDLSIFLQALFHIHSKGKEGIIDAHFRPQHLGCFYRFPPKDWTVVTTAGDPNLVCRLKNILGASKNESSCEGGAMEKRHSTESLNRYANLTELDEAILDAITKEEYEVLGPYLR